VPLHELVDGGSVPLFDTRQEFFGFFTLGPHVRIMLTEVGSPQSGVPSQGWRH
jgi:hypothetical protein